MKKKKTFHLKLDNLEHSTTRSDKKYTNHLHSDLSRAKSKLSKQLDQKTTRTLLFIATRELKRLSVR